MGSATQSAQPESDNQQDKDAAENAKREAAIAKFDRRFNKTVERARTFGFLERAWDRAALPIGGLSAAFLTATWGLPVSGLEQGLWSGVQPSIRLAAMTLLAAALATAIKPLFGLKKPSRQQALERMNKASGVEGRPASTYDGTIPEDSDAQSKAFWELKRAAIRRNVTFKAGRPRSSLPKRDPYALRFAALMVVGFAAFNAYTQGTALDNMKTAFDWKPQVLPVDTAKVDAWVTPPGYTNKAPVYIASSKNKQGTLANDNYAVPAGSVLTLRLHDPNATVSVTGGAEDPNSACHKTGQETQCEFKFSGDSEITLHDPRNGTLSWSFNVTPYLPPRISVAPGPEPKVPPGTVLPQVKQQPKPPTVTYSLQDKYGAEVTGGSIEVPKSKDPKAKPLPLFGLPTLKVPVQ